MKTIARFATRPIDDGKCDLILGKVLDQSEMLKPNHVYEIVEFLGTIIIKELGESSMGMGIKDRMISNTFWSQDCSDVVADGSHLITKEEANRIINERRLEE